MTSWAEGLAFYASQGSLLGHTTAAGVAMEGRQHPTHCKWLDWMRHILGMQPTLLVTDSFAANFRALFLHGSEQRQFVLC